MRTPFIFLIPDISVGVRWIWQ